MAVLSTAAPLLSEGGMGVKVVLTVVGCWNACPVEHARGPRAAASLSEHGRGSCEGAAP